MTYLFMIIFSGLFNPRFYFEAIDVPPKFIRRLALITCLILSLFNMVRANQITHEISQDFLSAKEYLPQYQIVDDRLIIAEHDKPLYFEGDNFQLVIDDTIKSVNNSELKLTQAQKNKINLYKPFGLYIIQNNAFMNINKTFYEIPNYQYLIDNPHRLTLFLNYSQDHWFFFNLIMFMVIFLITFIIYQIQMLVLAFLASLFNHQLSEPLPFQLRTKLVKVVSFVPNIMLALMQLIFPAFIGDFILLAIITMVILYFMFHYHTKYIRELIHNVDELDVDTVEKKVLELTQKKEDELLEKVRKLADIKEKQKKSQSSKKNASKKVDSKQDDEK